MNDIATGLIIFLLGVTQIQLCVGLMDIAKAIRESKKE